MNDPLNVDLPFEVHVKLTGDEDRLCVEIIRPARDIEKLPAEDEIRER